MTHVVEGFSWFTLFMIIPCFPFGVSHASVTIALAFLTPATCDFRHLFRGSNYYIFLHCVNLDKKFVSCCIDFLSVFLFLISL